MTYGRACKLTVLLVAPAVLAYLLPDAGEALIYDRSAILAGEFWRLVTGHWVHLSASHLFCDVGAVGAAAWLIESRGYGRLGALCLLSSLSTGLTMFYLLPEMTLYGGLSGIGVATAVYLGLHWRTESGHWRKMCLCILLLTVGKLVLDASSTQFAVIHVEEGTAVPVPLCHLVGVASGAAVYLWSAIRCRNQTGWAMPPVSVAGSTPERWRAVVRPWPPSLFGWDCALEGLSPAPPHPDLGGRGVGLDRPPADLAASGSAP